MIFGNSSINSFAEMNTLWFLTPNFSAVSFATSTSLKPRCSKPTENVKRFGFISLAIEAMIDESIPPDKNEPTGTSLRICTFTESYNTSRIAWICSSFVALEALK
ncbi:Uncharacterised protein [Streptococcus pneumoniae]|nr:Uncharacterised protein [Bacillus paranthracis]CKG95313.1 Uncharacterised protein [Streptococcus pneumoniae]CKH18614.1 Uncharacterised protein [Streptococcus pneumoniae]